MPFWKGAGRRKRDEIEPEVVRQLRARGVKVWYLNGRHLPDLLCHFRGQWIPLGVKTGERGRLTLGEKLESPAWPLVRSVDEALKVVVG